MICEIPVLVVLPPGNCPLMWVAKGESAAAALGRALLLNKVGDPVCNANSTSTLEIVNSVLCSL